jgi:nucleoside-diphosphate-sugar epimerase
VAQVVVTGAAGMIGSHVVERLVARGDDVLGVDNLVTGELANLVGVLGSERFEFLERDAAELDTLPPGTGAVLHLASPASPRHFRDLPVEVLHAGSTATLRLLELAERAGATFLFASSSEVYGEPEVHPQPEEYRGSVSTLGERACYDEAKRFSEAAVDTYRLRRGLDTRIARIFNTYGPRMRLDDGRIVVTFVQQALAGSPLTVHGDGSQTRSFCYVDDLADGIVALLDSDVVVPVNLGTTDEYTVLDIARMVISLAGSDSGIEFVPRPENDPSRRRPDLTRARELLGWEPSVPVDDGMRRTVAAIATQIGARVAPAEAAGS